MKNWLVLFVLALIAAGCGNTPESPAPDSDTAAPPAAAAPADSAESASTPEAVAPKQGMHDGEWVAYGADKGSTKYSSLEQINADNVADLALAWEWTSPDMAIMETDRRLVPFIHEVTPIVVNGTMYVSTGFSQVVAIDPETGATRWVFDTESWKAGRPTNLGFVHRGVAYWSEGDDERIYIGTGDMHLWCLDAKTGQPHPDFNGGEAIDLAGTMRRPVNRKMMQVSSPPVICNGVVVVGSSIFDGPTLKEMPPGDVRAFDARTGAEK